MTKTKTCTHMETKTEKKILKIADKNSLSIVLSTKTKTKLENDSQRVTWTAFAILAMY